MRIVTWIVRLLCLLAFTGAGYVAFDTIKAKRRKSTTAPFGDTHYESVKQAFSDHVSDADTPEMIKERRRLAGK